MKRYHAYVLSTRAHDFREVMGADSVEREASDTLREDLNYFAAQIRAATALRLPLVYAVLRREQPLVKIGTSVVLPNKASHPGRIARFGAGDSVRLVAVSHGDRTIEREVHERLDAHRVTADLPGQGITEHFRLCDDVVQWINETRRDVGLCEMSMTEMLAYSASPAA